MQKQRAYIVLILGLLVGAIAILTTIPPQQGLDLIGGSQLTIQVKPTEEITEIAADDLAAVKRVIENRVNEFGVSETTVQTVGNDKIVVQLPGESEPETAERRLQGTAKLEFRQQRQGTEGDFAAEQQNRQLLQLQLTTLTQAEATAANVEEIAQLKESLAGSNTAILSFFDPIDLTGANLQDARAQPNQTGNAWEVAINFDEDGGQKFAELTKNLAGTGRSLGIFLDDELISAPTVGVQFADLGITGGRAVITGNFDLEGANDLAIQIRGGSLPFPVEIVENRTVGATLGQDSINRSKIAGLAGLFLVLVFMGVYYRLPGLIADVSLVIYTILTLACYSIAGVTLTLPGIAGFILSIGMAVDANVLIFERTREELRSGKTLYRSVESGFYRAFSSILDSNVTTLIACGALFWLGSGLVKGFALTLAIGVLVSMFTAVSCSRTLMLLTVLSLPKVRQKPELFCPNLNQ
ncbi:protein-export membrane protein, SecD/SecF family [Xenococcus sp. PCC 7305]|uniref:protein translocase subunit SecD n=1 Tax=Xenococcus sp. PCC 7305 TaxID=102125 RepID=UPI0002AC62E3|nr:protein translocase subunit SecD [Xenococcus sp. PCC 7305]ELS02107.1 protein-export membrane protein, SecD/SecF family [Xenococcus sp. PCC 7305]